MFYLVGLGNPGEEYEKSRHNAGRMAVYHASEKLKVRGVEILTPDTFMNRSGSFVAKHIKSKKAALNLIVVYDDIDLALGSIKISFNKSSGGHNGLESVIKALKTREFIRLRIGIAPTTPTGKIKKPAGEQKVLDFLLSNFSPKEIETLKKVFKKTTEAILMIVEEGKERAMNVFN